MIDETRFRAFYQETFSRLWSYVHRMVMNRAECDDLVQETYFRMLRSAPSELTDAEMKSYLYRVATNCVRDVWRKRSVEEEWLTEQDVKAQSESSGPDSDLRIDLNDAMSQLSPGHRSLVWLAYVEGYEHNEIAQIMGIKSASVRVLLMRARRRLAGMLRESSADKQEIP